MSILESSDKRLNKIVNNKFAFPKKCPHCKRPLKFEVYCYKCYNKSNKDIGKLDNKIEKYVHSMSYTDLSSTLSSVRQSHVNSCILLGKKKRSVKSVADLHHSFVKKINPKVFKSYKELYNYSKKNSDTLFKNKKFAKKLLIKIGDVLLSSSSVFATDYHNYEYDKQLFIAKTIENVKSLMETDIKERTKDQVPSAKLGKYMRFTKKTDGTINQGKKYAYGKMADVLEKINEKEHGIEIMQVFREYLLKDVVKGEKMFLDGLIFLRINRKYYHPIVLELDDATHDWLSDPKYRLNDLAKNIFCKKNGISMVRLDTVNFNLPTIVRILQVLSNSKRPKLAAKKTYEKERLEHFEKLGNTYDLLDLVTKTKK